MKTAKQLLDELGYIPSSFDANAFMGEIEKFFLRKGCDHAMVIEGAYLGDCSDSARKQGFVADVVGEHSEEVCKLFEMYSEERKKRKDLGSEGVWELVKSAFGEDLYNYTKVYSYGYHVCNLKCHIVVDIQYILNAIALIRMKEYKVKKRKFQGEDYWSISLL